MPQEPKAKRERNTAKDYFSFGEAFGYFFRLFKPNAGGAERPGFNLRAMHTINKISILMFLVGVLFFIVKVALR